MKTARNMSIYAPNIFNLPNIAVKIASYLDEYDVTRVRMLSLIDNVHAREAVDEQCIQIRRMRQLVVDGLTSAMDNHDRVKGRRAAVLMMNDFMMLLIECSSYLHLLGPSLISNMQQRFANMWHNIYPSPGIETPSLFLTDNDHVVMGLELPVVSDALASHLVLFDL